MAIFTVADLGLSVTYALVIINFLSFFEILEEFLDFENIFLSLLKGFRILNNFFVKEIFLAILEPLFENRLRVVPCNNKELVNV